MKTRTFGDLADLDEEYLNRIDKASIVTANRRPRKKRIYIVKSSSRDTESMLQDENVLDILI